MTGIPRFAVIDVETSGLSSRRNRVLQVAVVSVDESGQVLDEWSSDVRRMFGSVGPVHIHGLTRRRLWRAPRFDELVPELARRFDGAVIVAHNIGFDWAFVRRAFRRAGYRAPDARRLCTLELSRSLDPQRELRHRLSEVCARYGVELQQAHDALADARATAMVLPHLLRDAGPDGAAAVTTGTTVDWSGSTQPSYRARIRAAVRPARSRHSGGASTSASGPSRTSNRASHRSFDTGTSTTSDPSG